MMEIVKEYLLTYSTDLKNITIPRLDESVFTATQLQQLMQRTEESQAT